MSIEAARNVAIVVALALVVWLAPGGGQGAQLVQHVLSAVFIVMIVLIASRLYRQFRGEIFGLGDTWRLALYVAVGVAVVTVAGSRRLMHTAPGTLVWFALIGAASYTVFRVWQRYRSYA